MLIVIEQCTIAFTLLRFEILMSQYRALYTLHPSLKSQKVVNITILFRELSAEEQGLLKEVEEALDPLGLTLPEV